MEQMPLETALKFSLAWNRHEYTDSVIVDCGSHVRDDVDGKKGARKVFV